MAGAEASPGITEVGPSKPIIMPATAGTKAAEAQIFKKDGQREVGDK